MYERKNFHYRNLPHLQPEGGEFFITLRLAGSIPKNFIFELKELKNQMLKTDKFKNKKSFLLEKRLFTKYDTYLDESNFGPTWLSNKQIAEEVQRAIIFRDQKLYDLYAFAIMSNHVHLIFKHIPIKNSDHSNHPISDIMRDLKKFSARKCNEILGRKGSFWEKESYDRLIRNEDELERTIAYTLNNPVKAGLVKNWEKWPFTYCKKDFVGTFI